MRPTARTAAVLALGLGLLAAPNALATDGNLYPTPPSEVLVPSRSLLSGNAQHYTLHSPAMTPAPAGDHLVITWRAPAGSEIASVEWLGSRSAAPSHMGMILESHGDELRQISDWELPQTPGGPRRLDWDVPGGRSNAVLRFRQTETRNQHERYYGIGSPIARVRDLAPPSCGVHEKPQWITADQTTIAWVAGDNFGPDGMRGQRIVADGRALWAGPSEHREANVWLDGLPDGVHPVTVIVEGDGTSDCASSTALRIDRTPPEVAPPRLDGPASQRLGLGWSARDSASGVERVQVQINDAPDGSASGTWRVLHAAGAGSPAGSASVAVPADLLDGRHAIRAHAWDGAGHQATAVGPHAIIDRVAPSVRAQFTVDGGDVMVEGTLADATAGIETAEIQVLRGGAWHGLGEVESRSGPFRHRIQASELGAGKQALRVRAQDAAGNVATSEAHEGVVFLASRPAAPGLVLTRGEQVRQGRLALAVAGSRIAHRAPRQSIVKVAVPGRPIAVRGRLTGPARDPVADQVVEARQRDGRIIGQTATRSDGRFTMTIRPLAGGLVRIGSPIDDTFVLPEIRPALTIVARGLIGFAASRQTAQAGGDPIVFSGRVAPSPRSVGIGRKSVILEWRDPLRESWRPVVTTRLRPDGTYRIAWRFQAVGLTIPMRVRVPRDAGWPAPTLRSRVIAIRVTG